tara:strand:+ start:1577 stop:1744 length:168 start_codon:yes stop_codon:yes gene_type:complete
MNKYKKIYQLIKEYQINPNSHAKMKIIIESDKLLVNGNVGHLSVNTTTLVGYNRS